MKEKILYSLLNLDTRLKAAIIVAVDLCLLCFCYILSMYLRLDSFAFLARGDVWLNFVLTAPLATFSFIYLGTYSAVVRHIRASALIRLGVAVALQSVVMFVLSRITDSFLPRSVPIIYTVFAILLLGGVRFLLKSAYRHVQHGAKRRVVIYGAGEAGRQLLVALQRGSEYVPVCFVDDSIKLQRRTIEGCRVHSPTELPSLVKERCIESILFAIPSATRSERRAILERLQPLSVRIQTIPGTTDIVSGRAKVEEIREVAIEDLLGRDPAPPHPDLMAVNIRGKAVLVSGAGGSIGSELCRQIISQRPSHLVMLETSEFALYSIDSELRAFPAKEIGSIGITPVLGSVRDGALMSHLLRAYEIETIYHAAAYKHVPMVERNVVEGVRNNVFGTLSIARAAIDCGVKAFILVSTDKAVRPTNIMGATKRMAEMVCQALAEEAAATRFSMVRFGNVLGSSGSVIPLFRRQIEAGGPITVTHREITRYFMTIPEAAQLVVQAGAMGRGGDVFVLDMGEPVRIADLAVRMAHLCGLKAILPDDSGDPDGASEIKGDIEIRFSGLRPGEKLYEELLIDGNCRPTVNPRILTATETLMPWEELDVLLTALQGACDAFDEAGIAALLEASPVGYFVNRVE